MKRGQKGWLKTKNHKKQNLNFQKGMAGKEQICSSSRKKGGRLRANRGVRANKYWGQGGTGRKQWIIASRGTKAPRPKEKGREVANV